MDRRNVILERTRVVFYKESDFWNSAQSAVRSRLLYAAVSSQSIPHPLTRQRRLCFGMKSSPRFAGYSLPIGPVTQPLYNMDNVRHLHLHDQRLCFIQHPQRLGCRSEWIGERFTLPKRSNRKLHGAQHDIHLSNFRSKFLGSFLCGRAGFRDSLILSLGRDCLQYIVRKLFFISRRRLHTPVPVQGSLLRSQFRIPPLVIGDRDSLIRNLTSVVHKMSPNTILVQRNVLTNCKVAGESWCIELDKLWKGGHNMVRSRWIQWNRDRSLALKVTPRRSRKVLGENFPFTR
jgi:hypothetical protein